MNMACSVMFKGSLLLLAINLGSIDVVRLVLKVNLGSSGEHL